jgi:hypothetical protein
MSLYSIALFLHVAGALLLFVTLAVEGVALRLLRRANTAEEGRSAAALLRLNRVVGPISAFGVLIPGLYMTATAWGWIAWILVALGAWVLIAVFGAVNGIRIVALERSLSVASGLLAPAVRARLVDATFVISWCTRAGLALGVIFLMTVKPDAAASAISISVAAGAGGAVALAVTKARGRQTNGRRQDRAA